MKRGDFIKTLSLASLAPFIPHGMTLNELNQITQSFKKQSKRMPVLFTSHGNPMDIPLSRDERPFWQRLYKLGKDLKSNYDVKAAVVVSAHWCTGKETMVNASPIQEQIFDYYGFLKEYYEVYYNAKGSPEWADEISKLIPSIQTTQEWGLDHGAWPMLMHLFPEADIPVFELSIAYDASPQYHFELGKQLKSLRERGVLIIGSGSLIHNLPLAMQKLRTGDRRAYGWEEEYDFWLKQQLESRTLENIINYKNSHKLGLLAAPTPDHFVPVLYSLGLMDPKDEMEFFYEAPVSLPAFSERSFILS